MNETYKKLVTEIRNYFKMNHFKKGVVGLSGGLDSAVVLEVMVESLGSNNVYALIMPEEGLTRQENIDDAVKLAKKLKIKYEIVGINPFLKSLHNITWKQSKIALMNTKARIRGVLLYNFANSKSALVVGTSNKSELLLGYFTKYGDGAVDFEVLGDLYKTEVFTLARLLKISDKIIKKKPSAELSIGQRDESELGGTYAKIDAILKKVEHNKKLNRKNKLVKDVLKRIKDNRHKGEMPYIIKVKE